VVIQNPKIIQEFVWYFFILNYKICIIPGWDMLFRMESRSFFLCFAISSSIFAILAGFRAHRHPFFVFPFSLGESTFSKHLFNDRLCRTEFWKEKEYCIQCTEVKTKVFFTRHHHTMYFYIKLFEQVFHSSTDPLNI
jgi:hypothetical protein